MTTITKSPELNVRTRHGRAVNAVAELLRSSLSVPNVYLEPHNLGASKIDVLAVDRAGAGDLHGVEIKIPGPSVPPLGPRTQRLQMLRDLAQLQAYPTHYKYLALPKTDSLVRLLPELRLFSPDGIGRTGILLLSEQTDGLPLVEIAIKPERYRVSPPDMEKIDRFLARNRPDIEVRI